MTFKAVIFDIDGTLVDSNEQHVSAWIDAFRTFGYDFDRTTIHRHIGKGGDMLVPRLVKGVSGDGVQRLGEAEGSAFKGKYRAQVKPFQGARELTERVKRDGKTAILASSASGDELRYWVDLLGVSDMLDGATSRDDVAHSKPAADIFRAALDKIAPVQPWQAVAIGDTPYDLIAATKNAIPSIAVRSGGFSDDILSEHHPLAIYDDVQALLAAYDCSPLVSTEQITPR